VIEYREEAGSLSFAVKVAPRASRSGVVGEHDGALKVRVAAPPVGGATNEELVRFLARALGVPTSAVELTAGHASKNKTVRVRGADAERLLRLVPKG
jgi:uncharacterized protein (TIGR00251 family)